MENVRRAATRFQGIVFMCFNRYGNRRASRRDWFYRFSSFVWQGVIQFSIRSRPDATRASVKFCARCTPVKNEGRLNFGKFGGINGELDERHVVRRKLREVKYRSSMFLEYTYLTVLILYMYMYEEQWSRYEGIKYIKKREINIKETFSVSRFYNQMY